MDYITEGSGTSHENISVVFFTDITGKLLICEQR